MLLLLPTLMLLLAPPRCCCCSRCCSRGAAVIAKDELADVDGHADAQREGDDVDVAAAAA